MNTTSCWKKLPGFCLRAIVGYVTVAAVVLLLQVHLVLPMQHWFWEEPAEIPSSLPSEVSVYLLEDRGPAPVRAMRYQRRSPGTRTLVYFHGNGVTLRNTLLTLKWFSGLGFNAYDMDYRGSGYSGGHATEEDLKLDALALVKLAARVEQTNPEEIVLFGQSFGTGLATYVSTQLPCRGLALVSPYTTLRDVAASHFLYRPLVPFMRWNIPQIEYVKDIRCPSTLIVHGSRDGVIPFKLGERFYKEFSATQKVQFFADPDADHHDAWQRHEAEIVAYLSRMTNESNS